MREKERSNLTDSPDRRFRLAKSHILSGRRNFEELFSGSSKLTSPNVILRYATYSDASKKLLVGFIAPKKIGRAVERIRTKRFLREAYRLNQHIISELPEATSIGLHYAFIAKHANLNFEKAQHDVKLLLEELRKKVLSINSSL